jgi:Zn-dependent protease with chaperone function
MLSKYKVHFKERFYLTIMILISLSFYTYFFYLAKSNPFLNSFIKEIVFRYFLYYIIFMVSVRLISQIILIGYLRGNAVKITSKQFPEIYSLIEEYSSLLGLNKTPITYVLQGNGILNAFATRFIASNYIVLYSDVLETAYTEGKGAVEFIIGHELGHVKRKHISLIRSILLAPAYFIPFLSKAYYRACEFTCDNIGSTLSPQGAKNGLLILAAGKELYNKVNVEEYIKESKADKGFITWLSEIFSSHPHLAKRLEAIL